MILKCSSWLFDWDGLVSFCSISLFVVDLSTCISSSSSSWEASGAEEEEITVQLGEGSSVQAGNSSRALSWCSISCSKLSSLALEKKIKINFMI